MGDSDNHHNGWSKTPRVWRIIDSSTSAHIPTQWVWGAT